MAAVSPASPTLSPALAWNPLSAEEWNVDCARHLLHRIGFSASPARVNQAQKLGLIGTLQTAFGQVRPMAPPSSFSDYTAKRDALIAERAGNRGGNPQTVTQLNMELNQLERQAFLDYVQSWLAFASQPQNSAQEKLVMFLGNVLVVAQSKVKDPTRLFAHADLLRTSIQTSYHELCKNVVYSPAMIQYLDLNASVKGVPNENFARELMELFTLGEGKDHYTENDVKEAARAFTGIVVVNEHGTFAPRRWDPGLKTIFGRSGNWHAADVVDLIFAQPAARTHLPKRFLAYYLAEEALPAPYLDELGARWAAAEFRVDSLAQIVFSSKLFYQPEYRSVLIKNPTEYYLGLCQDLNLDVSPFEGPVSQLLRSMGQEPFNPPNVRGWLGGKNWINSSTLAARRQLVQQLFTPVNENALNADSKAKLLAARAAGHGAIALTSDRMQALSAKSNEEIAELLLGYFLPGKPADAYSQAIIEYMQNDQGARPQLVRDVSTALFQSPEYHLC